MDEPFEKGTLLMCDNGFKAELVGYEDFYNKKCARLFSEIYADEYDQRMSFIIPLTDLIYWNPINDENFVSHCNMESKRI